MAAPRRYDDLQRALPDARGRRVVFLSHCLLNQNTRYLGGATCPGVVEPAVARYLRDGTGIVQLPCPEQRAWGGVLKRRFLFLLEHPRAARAGALIAPVARLYLRRRYRRLARAVVDDVEDHLASGVAVVGIVGVAGSPSCGVTTTLHLPTALTGLAERRRASVTTAWLNETVIGRAVRPGRGLFVEALRRELARRHLSVPFDEHDLGEGGGRPFGASW